MLAGRPKKEVAAAGAPAMRAELERDLAGMGFETPAADLGLVLPLVESSRSYIGISSDKAASSPMGWLSTPAGCRDLAVASAAAKLPRSPPR
ncbi:hypothetical protein GUJ93_ZPchr0483g7170 [Zizania palustris]|uniref:Uncharacterized protein n=1 Tax=Zizania palustris TaxID=103762 RepID=A0A8J5RD56_ZIZPA|nr:hypothetical protein GUJ93_ZPchr0483g7170 [Zizania palustris]